MGFDPSQIRKLSSDTTFHLALSDLQRAVAEDRAAGKTPFCVIANAGTVNSGAVDPLPALAEFCRQEGLWLHADGAYGAAAVLCDKGRALLEGLALVDSLSLDPHKWLFQPYEIGCVLVRKSHWLQETFHIMPEYLKDIVKGEEEINYCDYGLQLTRSFRALKLWMSLKTFGLEAFRNAIERGFALAEFAEVLLRESSCWEIVTPAQMGIVTFRFVPEVRVRTPVEIDAINQRIVDQMIADGFAMVSTTSLRGRIVLRFCTINARTTENDIRGTAFVIVYDIQHLVKCYPGQTQPANNDITLQIEVGEIFGILGENGAGKSTLVRQMVNLMRSTSGSIHLFGQDIASNPHCVTLNVGYMPQDGRALNQLTVGEALYFTAHLRGKSRADARKERDLLLDLWQIQSLRDKISTRLSGGQKRLLQIAVAMAGAPPVLILDEPTNDLDPQRRVQVWNVLRQLNHIYHTQCDRGRKDYTARGDYAGRRTRSPGAP
jgi:ABC-type cobalamin/Fe3+-siderophores transport system ATPase subunit